ncbi:MAG: hypothetical protein L0G87_01685 [Renibacterium salmoninarum]|nr:hypothetical protein [Renibacterium salmoninarum]
MNRAPRTVASVLLGVLAVLLASTGCISISSPDPNAASGPPPSYLERLKAAKAVEPTASAAKTLAEGVSGFAVADRGIACVLTDSRNGHVNTPFEPNNFADAANQPQPVIPVVLCELAKYPAPRAEDIRDDCGGTGIGYLGGVAQLAPDGAVYGACRAGLTGIEASGDDASSSKKLLAGLPVLAEGSALDAKGYRCVPMDSGVACANLGNGTGFFVAQDKYQLFGGKQQ